MRNNLPVYTVKEAQSKSRFLIYAIQKSQIETEGMGVDYAVSIHPDDVKYCWDMDDPLVGFRKHGKNWSMFCIIKPNDQVENKRGIQNECK